MRLLRTHIGAGNYFIELQDKHKKDFEFQKVGDLHVAFTPFNFYLDTNKDRIVKHDQKNLMDVYVSLDGEDWLLAPNTYMDTPDGREAIKRVVANYEKTITVNAVARHVERWDGCKTYRK